MTGPEHYRQAEIHIEQSGPEVIGAMSRRDAADRRRTMLAIAQVHATLALAAAMGGDWQPEGDGGE